MCRIAKIKLLMKTMLCATFIAMFAVSNVWAGNFVCNLTSLKIQPKNEQGVAVDISAKLKIHEQDSEELKKSKTEYVDAKNKIIELCEKANDAFNWGDNYWVTISTDELIAKIEELGYKDEFDAAVATLENSGKEIIKHKASAEACGPDFPYGCPVNQSCFKCVRTSGGLENDQMTLTTYKCAEKDPCGKLESSTEVKNSGGQGNQLVQQAATVAAVIDTNADGETVSGHVGLASDYKSIESLRLPPIDLRSNSGFCEIPQMMEDYTGTCYSCLIVSSLIRTFMDVAVKAFPVAQEAGVKLLVIGMVLWSAFFVLQKVSSFASLEPMKVLQELFIFLFKCLIAYTLVTSGISVINKLIVNPILIAGSEYGSAIIDSVASEAKMPTIAGKAVEEDSRNYVLNNTGMIDQEVFKNIMRISKKADAAVSVNFVIGEAVACHAFHAGAIQFTVGSNDSLINFYFPDIWIWLCGIVIWCFAFMLVMGVNFYLLDLSFKIGFAMLALPVTIGLWPFNKFKDKFKICIDIILNAFGTFLFLGVTTGMSIMLISGALGGTSELFEAIANDKKEYISRVFGLTSGAFLLILFAFIYSQKLISETVSKLADKFFPAKTSGLSPIHSHTTQAIDFAKKQIGNAASVVKGVMSGGASAAVDASVKKVARTAISKARRGWKSVKNKFSGNK